MTPEELAEWTAKAKAGQLFEYTYEETRPVHGSPSGYNWYGCRCMKCIMAWRGYQRDYYARNKDRIAARRKELIELDRSLA